jgi:hypothetical protein
MQRLSWWLEWPSGPIRVGVVFLVGVTVVAGVFRYPGVLRGHGNDASHNSALSYSDREVAGGNELVGDQQTVYQARGRIPLDDTFRVEVGEGYRGESDLTAPYVGDYFRYFLMPRRPAVDAPWIICYGCDLAPYGDDAEVVWRSDEGMSIVRLRR